MFKYFIFTLTIFFFAEINAADSLLTLKQQLDRLQREVNDLSKTVFSSKRDDPLLKSQKSKEILDLTAFDLRIYDLEKDIKQLNENFEELIFQLDDLKLLNNEMSIDINNLLIKNQTSIVEVVKEKDIEIKTEENIINEKTKTNNSLGNLIISSEDLSSDPKIETKEDEIVEEKKQNLSPDEEYQRAFDLLRAQQFVNAKEALNQFIINNKKHVLTGSAHYWLGEIYILEKAYRDAALILAEGFQKYPESIKAPEMLFKLSETLIKIDKKNDGCNTLKKFTEEFPEHKLVTKAKNRMKDLACNVLSG